jgi:hypothetical protein
MAPVICFIGAMGLAYVSNSAWGWFFFAGLLSL